MSILEHFELYLFTTQLRTAGRISAQPVVQHGTGQLRGAILEGYSGHRGGHEGWSQADEDRVQEDQHRPDRGKHS